MATACRVQTRFINLPFLEIKGIKTKLIALRMSIQRLSAGTNCVFLCHNASLPETHISHVLRPVGKYFHDNPQFEGVDFSTTVHQSVQPNSMSIEFVVPFSALTCYEKCDCTGQELINRSIVLINGERVALDLQRAESDFNASSRRAAEIGVLRLLLGGIYRRLAASAFLEANALFAGRRALLDHRRNQEACPQRYSPLRNWRQQYLSRPGGDHRACSFSSFNYASSVRSRLPDRVCAKSVCHATHPRAEPHRN